MTKAVLSVSWQEVESKAKWNCWRSCWQMRVHVRVHARHEEKELQYVTIITSSLKLWLISPDSGPLRYQSGVRVFVSQNSGTVATCTDSKPTHVIQSFRQIILELYFRNKWGYLFSTWCWFLFVFFLNVPQDLLAGGQQTTWIIPMVILLMLYKEKIYPSISLPL